MMRMPKPDFFAWGIRKQFAWVLIICCIAWCAYPAAYASDSAFDALLDETVSYFRPVQGKIVSINGKRVVINIGAQDSVKSGMRFQAMREEAPFRHPVTGELLGKIESPVGKLQVVEVAAGESGADIIEGEVKEGDKAGISGRTINLLFCQSGDADWHVSEYYYRKLKKNGRFQLIDTALETNDPDEVIAEARRLQADVALHLTTRKTGHEIFLRQDLYWATDGLKIGSAEIKLDGTFLQELSFGDNYFTIQAQKAIAQFDVPASAQLLIMCDVDGDGKKELVFSTGADLIFYAVDMAVRPALGGITVRGSAQDRHIWIDAVDLNKNGKEEIIITSMRGDDITSSIHEYDGGEFALLYRGPVFLRKMGDKLLAQAYSRDTGYDGKVYSLSWDGALKKGDELNMPAGVNIYDFIFFEDLKSGRMALAYDENGYFTVYDGNGLRLWKSKSASGDFQTKFSKKSPSVMIDRGTWSVKDRLLFRQKDILYVKRIPFLEIVKGFGYKKSQIRSLKWDGFSMEDIVVVDGVDGSILDYAVAGDKIIVLASPLFGIKAADILKGEAPARKEILIYSLKGM